MILKKITSSFSLKIVLQNEQKILVLKSVKVKTNFFSQKYVNLYKIKKYFFKFDQKLVKVKLILYKQKKRQILDADICSMSWPYQTIQELDED